MPKILIVDDQPAIVNVLQERCELEGCASDAADSWESAAARLAAGRPDLILLDVFWGEEQKTGLEILRRLKADEAVREIPVVVMTGKPDSQLTLEALSLGALDFVSKPLNLDELMDKIRRALAPAAPVPAAVPAGDAVLIGSSPEIIAATKTIWRLAQAQADVLILGDTGTGKGLAANLIHRLGPRKAKPFYSLNSVSITATLFENEVFGHETNAYTGAGARRPGRVEEAAGGIIFFDEIGDLPLEMQVKVLEFLETKSFVRVGGNAPVRLDVQILAATSQNLEEKMEAGTFRRDLYYRLQGNVLRLPLLRDHVQDIPALVHYFIQKLNPLYGRKVQAVAPEVFPVLQSWEWDGNVRELYNKVEAAVLNCPDQTLQLKDFSALPEKKTTLRLAGAALDQPYREAKETLLQEFHHAYLGHHLSRHHWNHSRTARAIGIMREQLNALIRRYKIKRPAEGQPGG
jgi:two-component system, NtrC family, response regulator AtoC